MSFLDFEQLPFVGMSYEFHGEKQGAPFSAYIVKAKPGQGPPLHIPANTPHRFVNSGAGVLRQIDIHASPNFVQTNL
jgi:hypothetical protein